MILLGLFILIALMLSVAPASAESRTFTLSVQEKNVDIGSGMTYGAWTYNGTVPGPVLHVKQGDDVTIHLINDTKIAHGIDMHAAALAPSKHFMPIPGKTELKYAFRAEDAGVFMYHCSAPPIVTHIANGMYGMMIVEPRGGWGEKAQEVDIVQGEFYGDPDDKGFVAGNSQRMMDERPDLVVFNGAVEKYVEHPIDIKVGELVRVFFVNAGPNRTSTFHLIGSMFSKVYRSGNPANPMYALQSFEVGPGDGAMFEFRVHEAGNYPFVDHAIARAYKGAIGVFHAEP
jgi:nitrite reductase (NO-forming)